jgi:hypothetical protein
MREIRMLRAMWRVLETELRKLLTGHEGGNAGHNQGPPYGFTRQRSDPTRWQQHCRGLYQTPVVA